MADSQELLSSSLLPVVVAAAPSGRGWSFDDLVVTIFAVCGFTSSILLTILLSNYPPILTAYLLATGLAALTYRFLGGIQGASFSVGALKLGGTLAALVGIATLVNAELEKQIVKDEMWQVTGIVTDETGQPLKVLDAGNLMIEPTPQPLQVESDGTFTIDFSSKLNTHSNKAEFPKLFVVRNGYRGQTIDLNPNSPQNTKIERESRLLRIKEIRLQPLGDYHPPDQALQ